MTVEISYLGDRQEAALESSTYYSLTMVNESLRPWVFYVYQKIPEQNEDIFSVAWFASPYKIRPNDRIRFKWSIEYNFVWSESGQLTPGVDFFASGVKEASPKGENTTTFSNSSNGPGLSVPEKGMPEGSLIINDADNVPNNRFSVGIGMSGTGTFVTQAGSNLRHMFTPKPSYWVAAGEHEKAGTVLDIRNIVQTTKVSYDTAVYERTVTLKEDNTWEIK